MQSEKGKQEQWQEGYCETALLTRKERDWLLGDLDLSKSYEYRLKSSIKKKIQTFINLELPLLIKNNLITSYEPESLRTGFGDGSLFNENPRLGKAKVPVPKRPLQVLSPNCKSDSSFATLVSELTESTGKVTEPLCHKGYNPAQSTIIILKGFGRF